MPDRKHLKIGQYRIPRDTTQDIRVKISETYTGDPVALPVRVIRGRRKGPTVFVSAAIHGDEINGTGIIHELMCDPPNLEAGTLLLIPVVNIFGFESGDRYMPDRRDLNRTFPGIADGSLASRVAHAIFHKLLSACDFGIDLHTAAEARTNFPNVRGDLSNPGVRRIARAFGSELLVNGKGPEGSLRRELCKAGCPTFILEAGEPRKMEPSILKLGSRGVRNVLIELGMVDGTPMPPLFHARVDKTTWVRAQVGGLLRFHVSPGDVVERDQPLATNITVFGAEQNVITTPDDGIMLSITTLPTVKPGEPICHIAVPRRSVKTIRNALGRAPAASFYHQARNDLATSISVIQPGSLTSNGSDNQ